MWRGGDHHDSFDARDDLESSRGGSSAIPDEKVMRFDQLLKRIETERTKMSAGASSVTSRTSSPGLNTIGTPTRPTRRYVDRSPNEAGAYDFAKRASQLRMSVDNVPTRTGTPTLRPSVRDVSPRSVGSRGSRRHTPRKDSPLRNTGSRGNSRSRSPSARSTHSYSHNRGTRSPSPANNGMDFKSQVDKFHSSLVSAHDTISLLEKDVRNLKRRVDEKDDCILSLEQRNKVLSESVAESRSAVLKKEEEKTKLLAEKSKEIREARQECDKYKQQAAGIDKLSSECESTVNDLKADQTQMERTIREKNSMIDSLRSETQRLTEELADGSIVRSQVKEKDKTISSLQNEIQRLNEELAEGTIARSKAVKSDEHIKRLEEELGAAKSDQAAASKVIIDLELRIKEIGDKHAQELLLAKNSEPSIAETKSVSDATPTRATEHFKAKAARLEDELDKTILENEELSSKVKTAEKRVRQIERSAVEKDEEIARLEDSIQDRERELKSQIDQKQMELDQQRARVEKYDLGCSKEQETVALLERAIEDLEKAHNDNNDEISRLTAENQELSSTLAEAEEYMKRYSGDMSELSTLKGMVSDLQRMNEDLVRKVKGSDEEISELRGKNTALETKIERVDESRLKTYEKRIDELEDLLSEKHNVIAALQDDLSLTHRDASRLSESKQRVLSLEEQIIRKNNTILELKDKLAELSKTTERLAEVEDSASRLSESKQRVLSLEEELISKNDTILELKNEIAELSKTKGRLAEVEDSLAATEATVCELRGQLDEHEQLADDRLQGEIDTLQRQKCALEDSLCILKNKLSIEVKSNKENAVQLEELRTLCENKDSEAETLVDTISNLRGTVDRLENNYDLLREEERKAWERVKELSEIVNHLESRREQEAEQMTCDPAEAELLREQLSDVKAKLSTRDEELVESRKGIAEAQKMIYRLMETVQELRKREKSRSDG